MHKRAEHMGKTVPSVRTVTLNLALDCGHCQVWRLLVDFLVCCIKIVKTCFILFTLFYILKYLQMK